MQLQVRANGGSVELVTFVVLAMMTSKSLISAATIGTIVKPTIRVEPPPHVFPEDDTKYKIYYNNSSSLLISDGKGASTASTQEIYEVLHAPQRNAEANKNGTSKVQPPPGLGPELGIHTIQGVLWNPKLESEMIQEPGAVVEKDEVKSDQMTAEAAKTKDQPGRWAALAAGIVLAIAVVVYVGLIFFRKRLERKYGSRHILVNEEENARNF